MQTVASFERAARVASHALLQCMRFYVQDTMAVVGKTCSAGCRRCSYPYSILLSSVFGIAGGYLCVTAILHFVQLDGFGDSEAFLVGILPLLLGLILCLSAVAGFVGIAKKSRNILLVDICGTVVVAVLGCTFFGTMLAYTIYIGNAPILEVNSTSGFNVIEQILNDYEVALFNECCAARGFGAALGFCTSQSRPCITNLDVYASISTFFVGPIVCGSLISQDKITSAVDANASSLEECGGEDGASQFIHGLQASFAENIPVLFAVTSLAVFLVLLLINSISILACCREEQHHEEIKVPEERQDGSAFRQGIVSREPETGTTRVDTEQERFTSTWRPGALGPPPPVPPRNINTSSESYDNTDEF